MKDLRLQMAERFKDGRIKEYLTVYRHAVPLSRSAFCFRRFPIAGKQSLLSMAPSHLSVLESLLSGTKYPLTPPNS